MPAQPEGRRKGCIMPTHSLKYISLFSGIEAASVAWKPLGWEPLLFSEIEPFPSAVLAHHYPDVPNVGDVTAYDWSQHRGEADIVVGGSPCQAFSVAGQRQSLSDDRGNLTLSFVEACDAVDPRYIVWENVPGVLNTKDNALGYFLAGIVGADAPLISPLEQGRWSDAGMVAGPKRFASWRILNAQYFGVPQRRRRIFLVAVRAGDGINPAAVLFERESLSRHPAPSREAGEGITRGAQSCFNFEMWSGETNGVAPALQALRAKDTLTYRAQGMSKYTESEEAGPVRASNSKLADTDLVPSYWDGGQTADCIDASQVKKGQAMPERRRGTAVLEPMPIDMRNATRNPEQTASGSGLDAKEGDPSPTLSSVHTPAVAFTQNQEGDLLTGQVSPAMGTNQNATGRNTPKVMAVQEDNQNGVCERDTTGSLRSEAPGHQSCGTLLRNQMAVRRLTPRECERLQGLKDDYTRISWRGKPAEECPDGPRYAAIGNSIAVPVLEWIGKRIQLVSNQVLSEP